MAAGLGLLSKYSGLFLGAGALVWLLASPTRRRLAEDALALGRRRCWRCWFSCPISVWQSQHHWMTFAFQFGRVAGGHLTARFLVEFLGAQLGLATPFIFVLAVLGAGTGAAARR